MDAQIWFAIFSAIFGGLYGAFRRLGEVSGSSCSLSLVCICYLFHCTVLLFYSNFVLILFLNVVQRISECAHIHGIVFVINNL